MTERGDSVKTENTDRPENTEKKEKKILFLTVRQLVMLLSCIAYNFTIYSLGRVIAAGHYHHDIATELDKAIPFIPWMIVIYWGFFGICAASGYILAVYFDREKGNRFVLAHFIGETVCFFFFAFFPTIMERPDPSGNGLIGIIMRLTYEVDAADNLLPSIHCFVSWLSWIGVRSEKRLPAWFRYLMLAVAASICVSTLTVKQHVIADVITGVLLAELSYLLASVLYGKLGKKTS